MVIKPILCLGSMKSIDQMNVKRFGIIWILSWTLTLALLLFAILYVHRLDTMENPLRLAKDYYALNMEYRKWNAQLGGVYAATNKVTPNPHLSGQHRDIVANDGTKLTLINDAYMSQMVFSSISHNSENPIVSRIVGLNPLSPKNSADPWERRALQQFAGTTVREVHQKADIDGRPYLRQIQAFVTEESCLKCHLQQGLKIGDILGGMSISIPLAIDLETEKRTDYIAFLGFILLWVVGSSTIAVASNWRFKQEESLLHEKTLALDLAEKYSIISDSIPFLIAHVDKDERYIFANRAYAEWVGLTHGNETILLVEDDRDTMNMATMILNKLGYTVLSANSTTEAVRLAKEHIGRIHLLLTDVVMPDENGADFAKKLVSIYPDLKVLFMSGYTADVISKHGILDEGVFFINKPFTLPELASKVRGVLDHNG